MIGEITLRFTDKSSRFLLKWLTIPILLLCSFYEAHAQNVSFYQVQAAYVYHFTKFVDWPDTSFNNEQTPFRICVLAKEEVASYFQPLNGRTSEGRPINIILDFGLSDVPYCHILVISRRISTSALTSILATTTDYPVLTVGESESFVNYGGMIGFTVDRGRVRLAVNLTAVNRSGLSMSAKLLEVAQSVVNQGDQP